MTVASRFTNCYYVKGHLSIVDLADKDGKPCYGESAEDTLKRYPTAELVKYEDAEAEIEELARKKYLEADPVEVTKERFLDMLEILPPKHWELGDSSSSFQIIEHDFAQYTTAFAKVTVCNEKKYFKLAVVAGTPHEEIIERIHKFLDSGKNA